MKHFTKCLKFLFLTLFVVGGVNSVWADGTTGTITFSNGTGATKIDKASVTGTDSQSNSWTITTVGTTSFNANAEYYQVGSSNNPATSITFTTTLSEEVNITAFSAKFGGFNGTAGTVTLKVGSTTVGTGSLNATNDVTVNSTSSATGTVLTVTVTDISKGVKCYNISYTYEAAAPSYTITPATNNEDYGTVALSGSTITATPEDGYRVSTTTPYEVTSGTATVTDNGDNTFSVSPSTACTVRINFEEIPKYTVTLSDNSSTLTEESAGAGVTLPSRSTIGDYTFVGWSVTNVATETTSAPTIIPAGAYAPTSNVTLYPVYTRTEVSDTPSVGEASTTIAAYASANSWSNSTQYSSINVDENITATASSGTNTGKYYSNDNSWRIYSSESATVTISAASGCSLNSVTLTYSEGAFTYSGNTITSGKAVSVSGSSAVFNCTTKAFVNSIAIGYTVSGSTTIYYLSAPVATTISTPTFTPAAGTYTGTQSVEIECATEDVTIYYTTNGDDPTTSSSVYSDAIEVSANTTIKAIAVKNEEQSNVGSATYYIKVAAPTFSVEAGTYNTNQTVSLECATVGATIYYTTDGSTPTTSSDEYDGAIEVASTTTIKAIAVKTNLTNSDVSAATYTLKVAAPTFSIEAGKYPTGQSVELSCATVGATIYYTVDNSTPSVNGASSSVYSSAITVNSTTTIKAIAVKSGYTESDISNAKYTIVLDNTPGTNYFEKVTNASTLVAGDNILLVNESAGKAMSATQKTNNRDGVDVTIISSSISGVSNDVQRILLQGEAGAWYFYVDGSTSGYLYAASSKSNYMKTEENKDDNAKATIAISSGDATITFKGSNTNNLLKYNSQSDLFSCYASGQDAVQIYKEVSKLPVTVSEASYATYVNNTFDLNFSESSIKAYKVKVTSKAVATLTQVDNVPAGTPVLLYKEGGATEAIPTMTDAAAVTDNDLVAGTGAAVATIDGEYTNMILNNIDSKIGFYYANDQAVAANRAYLHIATELAPDAEGAGARMRFVFADDASGIKEIATDKQSDGAIYNLSGQRVNAGYKGIVIKNGKKYLNK